MLGTPDRAEKVERAVAGSYATPAFQRALGS
jgi:hypothetical protein